MQLSLLLQGVLLLASVWQSDAGAQGSRVHFFTTHNTTSPLLSNVRWEYEWEKREINIGFNFNDAVHTLTHMDEDGFQEMLDVFDDYDATEPTAEKELHDRTIKAVQMTRYEIVVTQKLNKKSYTERVYKGAFADGYIEGQEARDYLTTVIFPTPEIKPFVYLFEAAQRMASPAYVITYIFDKIYDPHYTHYVRYIDRVWNADRVVRLYAFDIQDDTPKHYTPERLAKLFTPLPAHTYESRYTHLAHTHTPIRGIAVKVFETNEEFLDYNVEYMRFYSSKIDARAHTEHPPAQDLILAYAS